VIRNKEYLAAIRPYGKRAIALETMLFPDEIVDVDEISGLPDRAPKVGEKEQKMARQLIFSLSTEFDPDRYHDTYRRQVLDLIKKKAKGKTIEIETEEKEHPAVVDLMEALKASVEGSEKGRKRTSRPKKQAKRRSA
jgi:DNA end-binding protein Ku